MTSNLDKALTDFAIQTIQRQFKINIEDATEMWNAVKSKSDEILGKTDAETYINTIQEVGLKTIKKIKKGKKGRGKK
jgi:hypothetical protein